MQVFLKGIETLHHLLSELHTEKFLLVHDNSYQYLSIGKSINDLNIPHIAFSDFSSNPLHSDADVGVKVLISQKCDAIVAVGGGSSLDVAKCIKLDSELSIPLIAVPTTAGTGSESTKHIVVYKGGEKESLGDDSIIPNYVIFEPTVLESLPRYQKICTMFDALCQGIESYWSVNATAETRILSAKAIKGIVGVCREYIEYPFDLKIAEDIMRSANFSGQAINLTQTTAVHAMSYKLTSMYKIPHGHAVAICLPQVWMQMMNHINAEPEKEEHVALNCVLLDIARLMGLDTVQEAINYIVNLIRYFDIPFPVSENYEADIEILKNAVNPVRLKNNPVQFATDEFEAMYRNIVVRKLGSL